MERGIQYGRMVQRREASRIDDDGPSPGKISLTTRLAPRDEPAGELGASAPLLVAEAMARAYGLVQFDPTARPGREDLGEIHRLAENGMRGGGGALPHLAEIQRAFGHHDVRGVVAHVGGAAAEAATGMNAKAYASGDRVAFADAPDLRLAAHEAAHVVQQRGGVRLSGGVGERGDVFERHADDVADRVVRGESAEELLDGYAHRGATGGPAVQRMGGDEASLMLRSLRAMPDGERGRQVRGWSDSYTQDLLGSISEDDRREYRREVTFIEETRAAMPARDSETPEAGGGGPWDVFARAFDAHFPDDVVRHFRAGAATAEMDADGRRVAGQEVAAITGETMRAHFTESQRQRMSAYFENLHLPERLFNTGEAGPSGLSVVQRRLMSAHMLTVGTYQRTELEEQRQQALANGGSDDAAPAPAEEPDGPQQRIRARSCIHFVHLVNAYAGAVDATRDGVMGNFDHDGNIVLNSDREADRALSSNTPRAQRGNDQGPAFTKDDIDAIQPGDWLYIAMPTMHSVVFSQFVDETWQRGGGVEYRTVITYDQGRNTNEQGGTRHVRRIGPVASARVKTVHRREGGGPNAHAAQTPEDVVAHDDQVPRPLRRSLGSSVEADNQTFMREHQIEPEVALERVRQHNETMIQELESSQNRHGRPRLDGSQAELLRTTNAEDRLETRVRLNERLRILVAGARELSSGTPPSSDRYELTHGAGVSRGDEFNAGTSPTTGLLRRIWGSVPDVGRPPETCAAPPT